MKLRLLALLPLSTLVIGMTSIAPAIAVNNAADFVPVENIYSYEIDRIAAEDLWTAKKKPVYVQNTMMCDDTYHAIAEIKFEGILDEDVKYTVEGDGCKVIGKVVDCGTNGRGETICGPNHIRFDGPENGGCTLRFEFLQNKVKSGEVEIELAEAC